MKNSQAVFDSHMQAVATQNPNIVIADYTSDALFITPERTYNGSEEILEFYQAFLPKFQGFEFKTIKQEAYDNLVYFVWHGKTENLDVQFATDTYIVENGKIKHHTFAGIIK